MESLAPADARVNPERTESVRSLATPPHDPRLAAFGRLVAAADQLDHRAATLATRELRRLGYSVCLITPPGGGGAA